MATRKSWLPQWLGSAPKRVTLRHCLPPDLPPRAPHFPSTAPYVSSLAPYITRYGYASKAPIHHSFLRHRIAYCTLLPDYESCGVGCLCTPSQLFDDRAFVLWDSGNDQEKKRCCCVRNRFTFDVRPFGAGSENRNLLRRGLPLLKKRSACSGEILILRVDCTAWEIELQSSSSESGVSFFNPVGLGVLLYQPVSVFLFEVIRFVSFLIAANPTYRRGKKFVCQELIQGRFTYRSV